MAAGSSGMEIMNFLWAQISKIRRKNAARDVVERRRLQRAAQLHNAHLVCRAVILRGAKRWEAEIQNSPFGANPIDRPNMSWATRDQMWWLRGWKLSWRPCVPRPRNSSAALLSGHSPCTSSGVHPCNHNGTQGDQENYGVQWHQYCEACTHACPWPIQEWHNSATSFLLQSSHSHCRFPLHEGWKWQWQMQRTSEI